MRFAFSDEYKQIALGDYVIQKGRRAKGNELKYPAFSINNQTGFSEQTEQWGEASYTKLEKNGYKVIECGDFAYNPARINVGSIGLYNKANPCIVSSLYVCFSTKQSLNPNYLFKYLKSDKFNKKVLSTQEGGVRAYFFFDKFQKTKMWIPSLEEQQKVGKFLNIIDERIETQNKIIKEYETLRKSILELLISKSLSFGKTKIGKIIKEYNAKTIADNEHPVLSSTATGIFFQSDYFNKEAASENTTGYKCIPKGYCTYRSMSDTGRFYFNIQNITDIGIVSPAYPVFQVVEDSALFFVSVINNDKNVINQILKLKAGGTRFSLPLKKLIQLEIPWPDFQMRHNFQRIIKVFDERIKIEKDLMAKYTEQKSYLLENLFI